MADRRRSGAGQLRGGPGAVLGRAGRVYVAREGDTVWVGGDVVSCIEGAVTL